MSTSSHLLVSLYLKALGHIAAPHYDRVRRTMHLKRSRLSVLFIYITLKRTPKPLKIKNLTPLLTIHVILVW